MRKNVLLILVIILTFSCSSSIKTKEKLELSKNEKEIINNFCGKLAEYQAMNRQAQLNNIGIYSQIKVLR